MKTQIKHENLLSVLSIKYRAKLKIGVKKLEIKKPLENWNSQEVKTNNHENSNLIWESCFNIIKHRAKNDKNIKKLICRCKN